MKSIAAVLAPLALALTAVLPQSAAAQAYPDKPIKVVVPYTAGGAVDTIARIVGQGLALRLHQPVVVDNKPGASANIGMEFVAKSAPDGYTMLMASNGIATNMALFPSQAFDGQKDFLPVARIGYAPLVVVVPPASPAKSFKELIAMAKASPGKLNCGTAGNGSSGHLAGEQLKMAANVDIMHIPYKGGAPAITDLIGERLTFMPINPIEVASNIKVGKLRVLAVGSEERMAIFPGVPTVAESGYPDYEATVWWGLVLPANTPKAIVARLNAETQKVLAEPEIKAKLADMGVVVATGSPEQFAKFIAAETVRWSKVIKSAGIRPD
ncbi:MAG: tripartite tricarboxylate transporter substrate binding protein [Candidatus Protistobacter heckmanni]|nr:tripartite tricarboxylate transporter substrate binding protein [Candidatus Protistobacter heckmanni]